MAGRVVVDADADVLAGKIGRASAWKALPAPVMQTGATSSGSITSQ
jgi:hypothetical protein